MPTPYFPGQTTTIRSLPESTKRSIAVLMFARRQTQAEAISDAVEMHLANLVATGEIDGVLLRYASSAQENDRVNRRKPRPPHRKESEGKASSLPSSSTREGKDIDRSGAVLAKNGEGCVTPNRLPQDETAESPIRADHTGEQADLGSEDLPGVTHPDISSGLSSSLTDSDAGHS